ncbi:hypothetical protein HJC23_002179 [Cyclotella cryptica]|uniref:J domain-containing protein n=1 Tax=Cyclotella cryptica TaxID=29204 RepID=A0ABD3Q633_9STRA
MKTGFSRERVGNRPSTCDRKDPYEVLGVPRGATQAEIKTAYRRLAMKNHPDRVQGDEAKKQATAKFSEISAAYELLTTSGSVGASHPSFAAAAAAGNAPSYEESRPTSYAYSRRFGGGEHHQPFMDSFSQEFDPFGFGTFGNFDFSDPFELFRRTFGNATNEDAPFGPFAGGRPFAVNTPMGMNMATFGRFPSMFGDVAVENFPAQNFGTTTFSSSSFTYSGANGTNSGGSSAKMISTTTTTINGKTVTRREETIINPDGTRKTVIDLTGDDATDHKIPSIRDDDNREIMKHGNNRIKESSRSTQNHKKISNNASRLGTSMAASSSGKIRNGYETFNADPPANSVDQTSEHPRRYKLISKEKFQQHQSRGPSATGNQLMKSRLSENETYVIDPSGVKPEDSKDVTEGKSERRHIEPISQKRTSRKRKFCEVLYRCLFCCFPPCKRRRVTSDS